MEAPDKIYINNDEWHYYPVGEECEEYIRKDALLEWAKECFRSQDGGSWYSKGAADAYSKVINKLNEM